MVFLVLWAGRHLPGTFALPAGLGDVATGLAAPIVGYTIARWPDTPDQLITAYPLALVPLYAVSVSLILHGLVWQRLAARTPAMIAHPLAD